MADSRGDMKLQNSGEVDNIETTITYPRKVRVMVSDPDATDSSSDESGAGERPFLRRIVREIVLGVMAGNNHGGQPSNPTDSVDQKQNKKKKFPGVRMRKWGKWCTEVRDPIIKKRVWLGTFNTAEEAAKAYNARKAEIRASLSAQRQPMVVKLDHDPTRKPSKGVRMMDSGRWGAKIRDPFKKKQVWLGTFDTEEEASKAFEVKKMEFGSNRTRSVSKTGSCLKTPKTETLGLESVHGGEIVEGN